MSFSFFDVLFPIHKDHCATFVCWFDKSLFFFVRLEPGPLLCSDLGIVCITGGLSLLHVCKSCCITSSISGGKSLFPGGMKVGLSL